MNGGKLVETVGNHQQFVSSASIVSAIAFPMLFLAVPKSITSTISELFCSGLAGIQVGELVAEMRR